VLTPGLWCRQCLWGTVAATERIRYISVEYAASQQQQQQQQPLQVARQLHLVGIGRLPLQRSRACRFLW